MPEWRREHDMPGVMMTVPAIENPTTLERLIEICREAPPGQRLHANGSHWALSTAAMSDHTFIETHAPDNAHGGLAGTIHDVIPKCMNPAFLGVMRDRNPPSFEQNESGSDVPYFVHVEAGKRIYQIYAELDQPAENDPQGLAMHLYTLYGTDSYFGPWALQTLGGAGGQTVVGALTTGTHGGDFRQRPIADSVAALHLVTDGGRHSWIEPGSQPEGIDLTDRDLVLALYGAEEYGRPDNFDVIRDDDVFNAVLVSNGRFGVIYSVVLRVVRQYVLHERRTLHTWQEARALIADYQGVLYDDPSQNRFLQVAVCLTPHANSTLNLCGVTKRWNVAWDQAAGPPKGRAERVGTLGLAGDRGAPVADLPVRRQQPRLLERRRDLAARARLRAPDFLIGLLKEVCEEIRQLVEENAVVIGGAIAAVAIIGGITTLLGLLAALLFILAILLAIVAALEAGGHGKRLAQVIDELRGALLIQPTPELRRAGVFVWQAIAYKIFSGQQEPHDDLDAISYAVMDSPRLPRRRAATSTSTRSRSSSTPTARCSSPFVDTLLAFEIGQEVMQGSAFLGYASLRFTGRTRALIGGSQLFELVTCGRRGCRA